MPGSGETEAHAVRRRLEPRPPACCARRSDASPRGRRGRGDTAALLPQPRIRRRPAALAQLEQERPGRLDLGARVELAELRAAVDRVQAVPGQAPASLADPGEWPDRARRGVPQALELVGERAAEGDLGDAVADLARGSGHPLGRERVDLHQHDVARPAALDQGEQRRIGAEAAVPVGLAVDLHGRVELRQAGRGENHVAAQIGVGEDPGAPAQHVGRGHEQAGRRGGAQPLEVDQTASAPNGAD